MDLALKQHTNTVNILYNSKAIVKLDPISLKP